MPGRTYIIKLLCDALFFTMMEAMTLQCWPNLFLPVHNIKWSHWMFLGDYLACVYQYIYSTRHLLETRRLFTRAFSPYWHDNVPQSLPHLSFYHPVSARPGLKSSDNKSELFFQPLYEHALSSSMLANLMEPYGPTWPPAVGILVPKVLQLVTCLSNCKSKRL